MTNSINRKRENINSLFYDYVGNHIRAIIARFDLHESYAQIVQIYEDLCRDSLAFPLGARPPGYSRINHDGTPFQYAITFGLPHHTLQFLSETGPPDIVGAERIRVNRECINKVARRINASEELSSISGLVDGLAPEKDLDLLSNPAGAFWTGVAFSSASKPRLRIYINARWGKEQDIWLRLSRFATYFNGDSQWRDIVNEIAQDMYPLGTAITLREDKHITGRIYLSSYGKHFPFYERLADTYGNIDFLPQLKEFCKYLLGNDFRYPLQTTVCSFGFGESSVPDFKFELCAHCLFKSDSEAVARLKPWFKAADLDATDYWDMLAIISEGNLSEEKLDLHCYVGIGLSGGELYGTIYFKPRLNII